MNPLKYRPSEEQIRTGYEWTNNPLSNLMAWVSDNALPSSWCDNGKRHWTGDLVNYLWTDCSCCLCARFFALGLIGGVFVTVITGGLAYVLLWWR